MSTPEEFIGIIHGLTGANKEQHTSSKEVTSHTQQQIQELSAAVLELSTTVRSREPSQAALRLPPLSLPEFSGVSIDRFTEQLKQILGSSNIDPKFWLQYLKQQCQKNARAFDIICSFEHANARRISEKTTAKDHLVIFHDCLEILHLHRGIPKDQQIQQLLAVYYSMRQNSGESVAAFAHRFLETQHALEKLVPGIHVSPDGSQLELVHAFCIKLQPDIAKCLLSREKPFSTVHEAVECAKRHETVNFSQSQDAMALSTSPNPPKDHRKYSGTAKRAICRNFNRFSPSRCELPHNKCKNGYMHKCSVCQQVSCKALFHRSFSPTGPTHNNARSQASFPSHRPGPSNLVRNPPPSDLSAHVAQPVASLTLDAVKQVFSESVASLQQDLHSSIMKEVEKRLPAPPPAQAPVASLQDQVYGMPATPSMAPVSSVSAPDLANRNILWTKVTSAGVSLPLPLDSCCSVSLVSQNHATLVSKSRPDLLFTKLEQPIPVSVAGPSSTLRAVGTMQVPIIWENGRLATFTMLVVPQLSWPILFGQNHLRSTDAHIFSKDLRVYFAAPSMNFYVTCYDSSPLAAFPSLKPPQPSSCSAANVTCLLTPFPVPEGNTLIRLTRGLNILTVCLLLTSSFLNSPLFSGPLWLEGNKLSHGLHTVSGPIDLSSITQNSPTGHPQALFTADPHNYSKCRPSRPIMPMDSDNPTLFATTSQSDSGVDFSISSAFTTNILIHSQLENATLSPDIVLGVIRQQTNKDQSILEEAVRTTAENLSDAFTYSHSNPHHSPFISLSTNANHAQSSEILAPFLDHDQCTSSIPFISPSLDHPSEISSSAALPDLAFIAREFGKYLRSLPSKSAISSQACKFIYEHFPAARQLLATHGKLRGLVRQFPYLQLAGGAHGGTYVLSLNSDLFDHVM